MAWRCRFLTVELSHPTHWLIPHRLQTNHRGVFVLKDFQFRWLSRVSCADLEAKSAYEEKLLRYACGVLRGALANLGLEAAVTANAQAPACSFSVQLKT